MSAALSINDPSPGELASRGITIMCLARAVQGGDSAFTTVPPLITETLETGAWRRWNDRGGSYAWAEDRFQDFVETKPPQGLGTTLPVVEALLKPDSRAWVLFHEATRSRQGRPQTIHDNIMDSQNPDIVPFPAPMGTSASYAIRRLSSVPDLLEQVKAGSLSPNAAMVAAGFRKRSITIPDEPGLAGKRLLRHFSGERLAALIAELSKGL